MDMYNYGQAQAKTSISPLKILGDESLPLHTWHSWCWIMGRTLQHHW